MSRRAVEIGGDGRVSVYVDGVSANVMGCVGADGAVLVLPVARQLTTEIDGQPLYCGNVFSGISSETRHGSSTTRWRAGHALAARGDIGVFGLDCIIDSSGGRQYHDVNARVNGAVHAMDLVFPAYVGLVSARGWLVPEAVHGVEQEVHGLVDSRPIARWVLLERVHKTGCVNVPRSGVYRLDVDQRRASFVEGGHRPEVMGGDLVLLRGALRSGVAGPAGREGRRGRPVVRRRRL